MKGKMIFKRLLVLGIIGVTVACAVVPAFADAQQYLVLGNDLTTEQRTQVEQMLGVQDESMYTVMYTTHQDEVDNLGDYLPESVIGTRSISSVLITPNGKDEGITVSTQNINYCTTEMYQNALITAGVKDIDVKVAAPFPVSGTAALVGITKAYQEQTNTPLQAENVDAANDEIVTTQDLSEEVGQDEAAKMIATLKQDVAEMNGNYDREDVSKAIDDYSTENNLQISPETKEKVLDLMDKLSKVNIDEDAIKIQAKNIYSDIKGNIGKFKESKGFAGIINKIKEFFQSIIGFFSKQDNEDIKSTSSVGNSLQADSALSATSIE